MKPILLPDAVREAIGRLESGGYEAYAVGGCVRDSLLSRTPNDWDLTTSARPEQTVACFSGFRVIETGIKHGTVTVLLNGSPLEITTYRRDGAYADHRHPDHVTFSDAVEEDLARRDFTVNAMAYHPVRGLVDPFGGQADLARGTIACVGDPRTRFEEDGLRILRAVRFASVLGFSIDAPTAEAIHAQKDLLDSVARERVREELDKLLLGTGAVGILRDYSDVLTQILPELAPSVGFAQNTKYHCYDVFEHTLCALEHAPADRNVRLAVLLHDAGKPECHTADDLGDHFKGHAEVSVRLAEAILSRLRYDNAAKEEILTLVRLHDQPLLCDEKHVKKLLRVYPEETLFRLLAVRKCDILAHAPAYRDRLDEQEAIPRLIEAIKAENACFSLRSLAVNGDDLIAAGIPKGKEIGKALELLLDAVTDGILPNEKEALLSYLRRN